MVMQRKRLMIVAAAWLAALVPLAAPKSALAQSLGLGVPAPALSVKEFVKGAPIKDFQKGKLYVVEFWATWCGPCITSIPHLTELQKKYKDDVTFVGVSVWETDTNKVKPFVAQMGDKMAYRVAMDRVPAGAKGSQGAMAKSWMTAAGENGIPTAFVIGRDGKIAWIGHPMALDKPLAQIVAGTWNAQAAAQERAVAKAGQAKIMALQRKLVEARKSGDPVGQTLAVLDAAVADDPALERQTGTLKLRTLMAAQPSRQADALAYANRLADSVLNNNAGSLNELAWFLVDPEQPKRDAVFAPVALKAARRADDLSGNKEPQILDTLAAAYFASGDAAKALECQEKAVRLAAGTPLATDKSLTTRLEMYRKAAATPNK
jgi:thiol-disulfide isomerase/thioredoxin